MKDTLRKPELSMIRGMRGQNVCEEQTASQKSPVLKEVWLEDGRGDGASGDERSSGQAPWGLEILLFL